MALLTESDAAYHAHPAVSRSALWTLWNRTPAHVQGMEPPSSRALEFGSLVHTAILQPEEIDERYVLWPYEMKSGTKNTNQWKDFVAQAAAQGKRVLATDEMEMALRMRDNAHKHELVRKLVKDAVVEQSIYFEHEGLEMKARPDVWSKGLRLLGDIKTARSADPIDFGKSVASYGYHLQEAVYTFAADKEGFRPQGFVFIVVEKEPPHPVAIYQLDERSYDEGWRIFQEAVAKWKEVKDWEASYPLEVQKISLPSWAFNKGGHGVLADEIEDF